MGTWPKARSTPSRFTRSSARVETSISSIGGRYLDKYEKRDGTWKINERTIVTDWANVNDPSSMDMSHPITKDTLKGALDASDPSYQFFSLFDSAPRSEGQLDGIAR